MQQGAAGHQPPDGAHADIGRGVIGRGVIDQITGGG